MRGDLAAKFFRGVGVLQHERTLQIDRAVQSAGEQKVSLQQRAGLSKFLDHLFRLQTHQTKLKGVLQSASMSFYSNLVSDSTLLQETIELLRDCGGRANASRIVDVVFKVSHIDDELAGLLVGDLIRNDRRFKFIDGNTVELELADCETRLLDELEFVVVDVEATGAKMPPNRIIELGAYRIRGKQIVDNFLTLVNPEIPIPRFVASLTGINNDMVKQAPLFADVVPRWLEFVGDAVLIAHNAPFDTNFINHEISRVYPGQRMVNPHLCTVTLSRRAIPGLMNYRLETVAENFAISIPERHRAGCDALATAEIFLHLLDRLAASGVRDLAAAHKYESMSIEQAVATNQVELLPLSSDF
jgi:DNA polymerase III epsilon subunit family exonuclease